MYTHCVPGTDGGGGEDGGGGVSTRLLWQSSVE